MALTTRQSRKDKASTAPTMSKSPQNIAMESEGVSLQLDFSQQPAIENTLSSNPELTRGLESLNVADFLSYPLAILETALSPTQAQAGLITHDPSKADFKTAFAGNLAITEYIKSQYHRANMLRMQGLGITPRSLRLERRVNVYKPTPLTTITVRALQEQYEALLVATLAKHHLKTSNLAIEAFTATFSDAERSPNFIILALGWYHTAKKVTNLLSKPYLDRRTEKTLDTQHKNKTNSVVTVDNDTILPPAKKTRSVVGSDHCYLKNTAPLHVTTIRKNAYKNT
eukprot:GHVU01120043.1.p1 GENE.GHVU01120043.1~~GHVU01120043.1.p1  ORF type:complete len:284 (+),score=12.98 GHVU01120043.1:277-1128(+)